MKNETHEYLFNRLAPAEFWVRPQREREQVFHRFERHMYCGRKAADFIAWEFGGVENAGVTATSDRYYENSLLFYMRNFHITAAEAARRLECICGCIPTEIVERVSGVECL